MNYENLGHIIAPSAYQTYAKGDLTKAITLQKDHLAQLVKAVPNQVGTVQERTTMQIEQHKKNIGELENQLAMISAQETPKSSLDIKKLAIPLAVAGIAGYFMMR